MSDDSKQLSVAELLARNGQQGAASSGGGRRRRGGRGISVAELTGDLPVVPSGNGRSSHAAPDEPDEPAHEPAAYEPPTYEPAYDPSGYQSAGYSPSSSGTSAPEPVSYTPPVPEPESPSYSPMSGPITRYDPLSTYSVPELPADPPPGRSNRIMPGREMPGRDLPSSRHAAPADPLSAPLSDLYAASPEYAPPSNPYAPDPVSTDAPPPLDSGRTGRRRRHAEPAEETTEVRPLRDLGPAGGSSNGHRGANGVPLAEPVPQNGSRTGRAARRRAEEAAEAGPSTAPWSPSTPESAPLPLPQNRSQAPGRAPNPEPPDQSQQRSSRRDGARGPADGGLPAWSARRHVPSGAKNASETGGIPTSAWSPANQDQQLVSGQTVAGDLLRDSAERADARRADAERADTQRKNGRGSLAKATGFFKSDLIKPSDAGGRRGRSKRDADHGPDDADDVYEGLTDVYEPFSTDDALDEHDAEFDEDGEERSNTKRSFAAAMSPRRSRVARKAEFDANRKQWLILGGQSTGAAVAGMLLFKGFERMWEMLPWVALALAMIVILGLVALVRILRRTDDILSTVIAVVVGIFVTLGPLAFLLSTN